MIVLYILFLLCEIAMLSYIIFRIKKSKQISLKDTIIYPFLVLVSFLIILFGELEFGNQDEWYKLIPYCFSHALDIIRLALNQDIMELFYHNSTMLLIDYSVAYLVSGLALFSISVSLVKVLVKNKFKIKLFNDEINYLFTLTNNAKTYIKGLSKEERKKTVVLLQKDYDNPHMDEKLFLDDNKVKYIISSFDKKEGFFKTIRRSTRFINSKKYSFVSFYENDKDIYNFVNYAKAYLKEYDLYTKNIKFIVNTDQNQNYFVKELIKGNDLDESKGAIRAFDKYELLAFDFVERYPLSKYMAKKYYNENSSLKDIEVNLFMIGFGSVNQALLKDLLIETQFVKDVNGKVEPLRMNVHIYEKKPKYSNITLSSGIFKYRKNNYNNNNEHFDLPDDYFSHVIFHYNKDVGEIDFLNGIDDYINKDNQMNYFIVSISSDFENSLIAKKIKEIGDENSIIFVRTKEGLSLDKMDENIITFGKDSDIFKYNLLIANEKYKKAMEESLVYSGKKIDESNINIEWAKLSRIKQNSNLSAVSSIPFKLGLLGSDNYEIVSVDKAYLSDDFKYSSRDIIAYSEHERWVAFELSEGVLPMKISDAFNEKVLSFKNKNKNELEHLCITTHDGLIEYYNYVENLNKKYNLNLDSDVIRYDYDLMDNYFRNK